MQKFFNRVTLDTRDRHLTKINLLPRFLAESRAKSFRLLPPSLATAKLSAT